MRLATAMVDDAPALFASAGPGSQGTRFFHVDSAAKAHGMAELQGLRDVRALYDRAGDEAVRLLCKLAGSVRADELLKLSELELLPPVLEPRAIVCVGRNYAEHVAEGNLDLPAEPLLFSKFTNTLRPSGAELRYPRITTQLDYEGELAVIIGRRATAVAEADAFGYIAGYTIINDISARDLQDNDLQWIRGKSLDGFAPIGPVVLTADEVSDPYALRIETRVNGEVRQDSLVAAMHFKIPQLLRFITEGITLEPGDVVATGTPAGVALGFDPPKFLRPGDDVSVRIDPIGELSCRIRD